MNIPKSLKIGGHTYKVEVTKDKNKIDDDSVGCLDRKTGTIYISEDLIQSEREATLLHEILHTLNGELTETFVEGLAQQLYQVLSDNQIIVPIHTKRERAKKGLKRGKKGKIRKK